MTNQTHIVPLPFFKMDGAGNSFIILDTRGMSGASGVSLMPQEIQKLAHPNHPITKGFDQLIIMEPSKTSDCFMRIFNSDGSEVASCGNASRCIGWLLMREKNLSSATFETLAETLKATRINESSVQVDMGVPRLDWKEIPLAREMNTLHLPITLGPLSDPVAVNMGNPHAVFFVPDTQTIDLQTLGPPLEHHELFPERANIGVAHILAPDKIRLRVFERGAGETLACGTGACAAVVAAVRRSLTERAVDVELPGGILHIEWLNNNHVLMAGAVRLQFEGTLEIKTSNTLGTVS